MHPQVWRRALAVVAALGLGACGSSDAASPPTRDTVGGVGALPGTLPGAPPADTSPAQPTETADAGAGQLRAAAAGDAIDGRQPLGRFVDGNRVLVIGDSIVASISNRYGDQLCARLVPRGWVVQVDAEVSRFVEFGRRVLERHDGERWDVAVVMLGNNYDGDPEAFARELDLLLDELEPSPVVLVNVTRFEPQQDEVNYVLARAADERDGVRLLDWAARTADGAPNAERLLADDGLHLSTAGQEALASMIASTLGRPPTGSEGECLPSPFDDDSGGRLPVVDGAEDEAGSSDDDDPPADTRGDSDGDPGTDDRSPERTVPTAVPAAAATTTDD